MKYFSQQYKALLTIPNKAYSDVKAGLQPFFMTKQSYGLNPADVVCVEPEISKDTNDLMRQANNAHKAECEYLLITSVRQLDNYTFIHGFVRISQIPLPVNTIIDALFEENRLLREACKREGLNADLIALGLE